MGTHKIHADLDVDGEVQGTSLDINGNADISGDLGVAGAIYQTNNGTTSNIGVFMPMVQGGLKATSASTTTIQSTSELATTTKTTTTININLKVK